MVAVTAAKRLIFSITRRREMQPANCPPCLPGCARVLLPNVFLLSRSMR